MTYQRASQRRRIERRIERRHTILLAALVAAGWLLVARMALQACCI